MGYSKEQVVELFEELECKIVDIDCSIEKQISI